LLTKPYTLEECAQLLQRWIGTKTERPAEGPAEGLAEGLAERPAGEIELRPSRDALSSVDPTAVASLRNLRPGTQVGLYSKLVDLFRVSSSKSLAELHAALTDGDFKTAGAICHKLTSSAANVGALIFAKDVRLLGQMCAAEDAAAARQLHADLDAAHPALLDELMRLQLRESA